MFFTRTKFLSVITEFRFRKGKYILLVLFGKENFVYFYLRFIFEPLRNIEREESLYFVEVFWYIVD